MRSILLGSAQGDARRLPYPDATFDAAYLVTVLGEIPDQEMALRQRRSGSALGSFARFGSGAAEEGRAS